MYRRINGSLLLLMQFLSPSPNFPSAKFYLPPCLFLSMYMYFSPPPQASLPPTTEVSSSPDTKKIKLQAGKPQPNQEQKPNCPAKPRTTPAKKQLQVTKVYLKFFLSGGGGGGGKGCQYRCNKNKG